MLFQPYELSHSITLKNRIVMAPMTRCMTKKDNIPTEEMATYYAKRADAGLIITEGTIIRRDGLGYDNVPGMYTSGQIQGWKKVTDAVHKQNGTIFSQIWHVGRVSHPDFLNGELPLAPSETTMSGKIARSNNKFYGKSRALTVDDINSLIQDFRIAAQNAMEAGFDGIEIHGANGYLIDQFLHYDTNHREDAYGGTPDNMCRFPLAVVDACIDAIGKDRVAIRLSPAPYMNEIKPHQNDKNVFAYLLAALSNRDIAYVHTGNFNDTVCFESLDNLNMTAFIRQHYQGNLIGCGSYSFDKAIHDINQQRYDLIAFGRPFIANPDLIYKLKEGIALTPYHANMLNTLD